MSEKPLNAPPLGNDHHDGFVHPTAPPSYEEAMDTANRINHPPYNPYQAYPTLPMPSPAVSQPMPPAIPQQYPPPVPQNVPVYPRQVVNVPGPPGPMSVTVQATQVIPMGPKPMRMACYHCGADIKTTVVRSYKASAHLTCLFCCIFMCWFCSCLPYCLSSFKKVDHKCPNCKGYLGSYNA